MLFFIVVSIFFCQMFQLSCSVLCILSHAKIHDGQTNKQHKKKIRESQPERGLFS